jgi:glycosyltransferase involved in cell wall biosynthesis
MSGLRLFVMHSWLVTADGHPYTESLGWRRLCRERGIALDLFASLWVDAQVQAETGAQPLFGSTPEEFRRFMTPAEASAPPLEEIVPLQTFMVTSFETAKGCRKAWAAAAEKPAAMIFPWANAGVLNGVAEWLADVEPGERPALVFNIVRPEPSWRIDADRRLVTGDFSWFRFACRRLRSLMRPDRLVFTAVEPRLSQLVHEIGEVDCQPGPLHKFYASEADLSALRLTERPAGVSVGALGPSHTWEKGWDLLPEVIGRVCAARSDVSFFVQVWERTNGEALADALQATGAPVRVSIHPGSLSTQDYFRRVLASDLILLPYNDPVYALMPSGIFADAVVSGTPVVAPAGTWLSDRLDEGWGAGITFSSPSAALIADAVLIAIERLGDLRVKAAGQGEAWRKAHSLEAYLDHVMARLDLGAV